MESKSGVSGVALLVARRPAACDPHTMAAPCGCRRTCRHRSTTGARPASRSSRCAQHAQHLDASRARRGTAIFGSALAGRGVGPAACSTSIARWVVSLRQVQCASAAVADDAGAGRRQATWTCRRADRAGSSMRANSSAAVERLASLVHWRSRPAGADDVCRSRISRRVRGGLVTGASRAARWGAFVAAIAGGARDDRRARWWICAEAGRVGHADAAARAASCVLVRVAGQVRRGAAGAGALPGPHPRAARARVPRPGPARARRQPRRGWSHRCGRGCSSAAGRSRRGGDAAAAARDGQAAQPPPDARDAAAGRARRPRHQARVPDEPAVGRAVHEGRRADLRPRGLRRGVAAAAGGRVGAIVRGAQLVVVGDPKQLPPTSFFATPARGARGGRQRGRRRRPRRREHPRGVHGLRRAHEPAEVALPQRARVADRVLERQLLRRRPAHLPQRRTAVRSSGPPVRVREPAASTKARA